MGSLLQLTEAWRDLPPAWTGNATAMIRDRLDAVRRKVVVLDDDPTGTQTVHEVSVLTAWDERDLEAEFRSDSALYILTNSRSLPLDRARELNRLIARTLVDAAKAAGRDFVVVSRSDSTLRGHFPGEVDALIDGLGVHPDGILLIPCFPPGGRFTFGDVHYVAENGLLTPAAESAYAQDPVFGYRSSNLRHWVEEKTGGRITRCQVESISIEDIRCGGPLRVAEKLRLLKQRSVCIVNAVNSGDLEVFTAGLLEAEAAGKQFVYRTAASFVPVRAGIEGRPLLSAEEIAVNGGAGALVVAGSFVPCTTAQIEAVLAGTGARGLELRVDSVLDDGRREPEVLRVTAAADEALAAGVDVVIFSSRQRLELRTPDGFIAAAQRISSAITETVRRLRVRPRYLIAKGGITASDLATRGLGVRRARVLGQILPGVPVWELGPESRFPGLSYIVFPGNVGAPESILHIVRMLAPDDEPAAESLLGVSGESC